MFYVFYNEVVDGKGKVDAIFEGHQLSKEKKKQGIFVNEIPIIEEQENKDAVLYVDIETSELTIAYEPHKVREIVLLEQRLREAEDKLRTPKEYYESLSLKPVALEELKKAKIEALKYICTEKTAEGFLSKSIGYVVGFDDADQRNLANQLILFLADPTKEGCDWKMKDGNVHTLTKVQFMKLPSEGEAHTRSNIMKLWGLVSNVNEAESKQAISSINW